MTNDPITRMHHNITDETRRRLALCLAARPTHRNRLRRQLPPESPYLGWLLLAAILIGIAVIAATHPI